MGNLSSHLPEPGSQICVSVIVLNYNGLRWLERCLGSLRRQSIFPRIEVIVADNASPDGSDRLAEELMTGWPNARVVQHGENLGYCEGNNRAAKEARGRFLFFLNNDTWLEDDCLEKLLEGVDRFGAAAAAPKILAYEGKHPDTPVARGFDCFGLASYGWPTDQSEEIFIAGGCSYLIRRDLFEGLGGFDPMFYMYADECDLSWRVWVSGHRIVSIAEAQLHHRGAANVNPSGVGSLVELRTSDRKRFYANRNGLLVALKNAEHLLLITVPSQLVMLAAEALLGWIMFRRWSFVRNAYLEAVMDCLRLWPHVRRERRRLRTLRRRSDWWMLRFLRLMPGRMEELRMVARLGRPKVTVK